MIRYLKAVLLTGWCLVSLLQAHDINDTLVKGDETVYSKLLNQLQSEKNVTSEEGLEESLLRVLLADLKKKPDKQLKIIDPKDQESYRELFETYIRTIEKSKEIQSRLAENRVRIHTIENEIRNLEDGSAKIVPLELQDALYHKNRQRYQQQVALYENRAKVLQNKLVKSLRNIQISTVAVHKMLKENKTRLEELNTKLSSLHIEEEQAGIVGNIKESTILAEAIGKLEKQKHQILFERLSWQFLLFSDAVQRQSENAFSIEKTLLRTAEKVPTLSSDAVDRLTLLLHAMESQYMGTLQTLAGAGTEELKTLWYQAWEFVSTPRFHINQTPISILKLALTLIIFIMGFVLGALYKRKIKHIALSSRSFTVSTRTLLANMGYYLIITIAFFVSLNVLGIKLSSLALVAGALSVGIGFGLKNIVSNFVSGLILMFERSIKIGDYIQLDENLKGYVSDIRMRSTTVVTNENIDVIIPNQKLIENNVINWTMSDNIRRFAIPFGVAYATDVHKVIDVVTEAVLQSDMKDDIINNGIYQTKVIMTEMGDSSVNFELFVWVKGEWLHKPKRTASRFLIIIYDTLYANNIEIPFPQQDIHIRSVEDTFVIQKKES